MSLLEKIFVTPIENLNFLDCSVLWSAWKKKKIFFLMVEFTYLSFKFMLDYCCIGNLKLEGILHVCNFFKR